MFNELIVAAINSQLEPKLKNDARIRAFLKGTLTSTKRLNDALEIINIWLKSNYGVDMKVEVPELSIWINGVEVPLNSLPDLSPYQDQQTLITQNIAKL